MDWSAAATNFGVSFVMLVAVAIFAVRYLWPFVVQQIKEWRAERMLEFNRFTDTINAQRESHLATSERQREHYTAVLETQRNAYLSEVASMRAEFSSALRTRDAEMTKVITVLNELVKDVREMRLEFTEWRRQKS